MPLNGPILENRDILPEDLRPGPLSIQLNQGQMISGAKKVGIRGIILFVIQDTIFIIFGTYVII